MKKIQFILFIIAVLTLPASSFAQDPEDQNSTEKIRVVPNAIASKIGTAVLWESEFAEAKQKSAESGKPIFWYVPRLAETFMDRKNEVDRYMRAGPFSNPGIIASINEHYVPLMAVPEEAEAKTYELLPFKFIEPGFLIVESDGAASTKIDRITTMHSAWLASFLKPATTLAKPADSLLRARQQFANGEYDKCQVVNRMRVSKDDAVELQLISAMAMFRQGKHDAALKKFASVGESFSDHPLGWKAAAEAQRIGPFVRGFEVYRQLPAAAMNAGRKSAGSAAPENTYSDAELWKRGIEFLLSMQNDKGCFNDSDYDFGGTDSLPNVHAAVTSIAAMALVEAHDRPELAELQPRIAKAIERAVEYVSDESNLNLRDRDEIFWAYLYRLRLLNRIESKWKNVGVDRIGISLKAMTGLQTKSGDWYHEYNNPFVTASALWAIKESESLGARVDASSVEAGIAALKRCRYTNSAFAYATPRRRSIDEPGSVEDKQAKRGSVIGSAGRMPLCDGALVIWEQAEHEALVNGLKQSFEMHEALDKARKYDNHTSSYSYGGFFFWYDMESRTEAILKVADEAIRKEMAEKQRDLVVAIPEIDGCFVDSHEIGRSYGTAMALLCLSGCEKSDQKGELRK